MTTLLSPHKQPKRDQLVFVYGTLKEGFWNHVWLPENTQFSNDCRMADKYPLVIKGLPYLLPLKGRGFHVKGECYLISQEELELLDELESHPFLYRREKVGVVINDIVHAAWVYFLTRNFMNHQLVHDIYHTSFTHASNPKPKRPDLGQQD